ncbi:uroporphyrinogen-III C-methyltransferase [Marinimicrobium alkaliphilum]|uniref:uroporphyrinogen-III C-methyltransferase n=1 Tax=Marinimicrobium alkaliphilum TaxID=2202654 RepID=UPI001300A71C|nr:uroporphyrinogen-III C-methyltransferase [Marinimicrobium alkaliphilum]
MTDDPRTDQSDSQDSTKPAAVEADLAPGRDSPEARDEAETSPPQNDKDKSTEPPAHAKGAPARPIAGPRPRRLGLVWLLLLVVLLGAGAGGYWLWLELEEHNAQVSALAERLDEQRRQLDDQRRQLDSQDEALAGQVRSALAERDERLDEQAGELRALADDLRQARDRLSDLAATDRISWQLAEAEHLLRLAGQRLSVDRNAAVALNLSRAADRQLRDAGRSDLSQVRRALAREINALEGVEPVDREGIYLRLAALSEEALSLSAPAPGLEGRAGDGAADTEAEGSGAEGWRGRLEAAWLRVKRTFSDHLRIRRHDGAAVDEVMAPENQVYLAMNLQLKIQQAQMAWLREEPEIYRASLSAAGDWLERYYPGSTRAEQVREELSALAEQPMSIELPSVGEALERLERYRRSQRAEGDE